MVGHLAAQLGIGADVLEGYDWTGRTGRRHRRLVLDHLAVAPFDDSAEAAFRRWLADDLLPREPGPAALEGEVGGWFAHGRVIRSGTYRLDRIVRSARAMHDDAALQRVAERLDAGARGRLDALLAGDSDEGRQSRDGRQAPDRARDCDPAEGEQDSALRSIQDRTALTSCFVPRLVKPAPPSGGS